MDENLQAAVQAILNQFPATLHEFREELTLQITPERVVEIAQKLRDQFKFDMLMDVTAVDYWPQQSPRFHVIYQLFSLETNQFLRLRAPLDGNDPHIHTLSVIYPSANWFEREVWDMFGVHFDGHPDPRRIIMPADWQGHPLRKDYPLGYEEVQFDFNFDEIDVRKPRPQD
jgi:NADH-quinone oxidoreductase subunit C